MKKTEIPIQHAKDQFKIFLASKNLKLTSERERILEVIFSIQHHIDVLHIYDEARKKFKDDKLSLATIYRTIPLLEEAGLLKSFHAKGDQKVYECMAGVDHHDHLICVRCGKITEFTCEEIEGYQQRVATTHHYKLLDHRLELFGLCEDCR